MDKIQNLKALLFHFLFILLTDAGESEFGGNILNLASLVSASNLCTEVYFDVEVAYGIAYWIYSQPILLKISMYYLHSILLSLTDSLKLIMLCVNS